MRRSVRSGNPYCMALYVDGAIKNLSIRCRDKDQKYAIGSEKPEETVNIHKLRMMHLSDIVMENTFLMSFFFYTKIMIK